MNVEIAARTIPDPSKDGTRAFFSQQIAAAGPLNRIPNTRRKEFLVARSGVALVYPAREGAGECFVVIRVSSMADPADP